MKPSIPFQELLQLAKEFEKAPNSQKKKHFWSSGELEKMKPWQHLLAMRPGTTAPADLKTGTWVWCGACHKEIKTFPFLGIRLFAALHERPFQIGARQSTTSTTIASEHVWQTVWLIVIKIYKCRNIFG